MPDATQATIDARGRALACPVCGAREPSSLAPFNGYDMSRCGHCALVFTTQRRIPAEQYEGVYSGEGAYREMLEAARLTAQGTWGRAELWWFKRLALRWLEVLGVQGRLVDIGSGPGTFLMVARTLGFEVSGVEPTELAARTARELGVPTHHGVIEDLAAREPESRDVATCFEVMEHVPDVTGMLRAIHSVLRPGGLYAFSVPNLDDPYCLRQTIPVNVPPVHINFFNRQSLGVALDRTGFDVLRFRSLPIPTSSVRNNHGVAGFAMRLPWLALLRVLGRADGTALVGLARRR